MIEALARAVSRVAAVIRLPAAEDPAVSVIALLDGEAEMAERCLRAIAAAAPPVATETVLLLNDPDPELEDLVRKGTSGARVVLARANAGPGVGWNLGAAVARAPRLATLHEDSEPEPGWLGPLCEAMDETGAGAVGSRLFNDDGSVQNCGWVLFSDASHWTIDAATAPEVVAASEPTPADMLSGASMLVDREAVRAVGGWDERFHPAVYVDIDVSTAIWSRGRPVLSVPASRVRHRSGTFDRRPRSALTGPRLRLFLFERNRGPFGAKWGEAVTGLAPPPAGPEPERIAAAVQAALIRTRERAERVRAGGGPVPDGPVAERRFTALAEPPVLAAGEGACAVAPPIVAGLRDAEAALVDEYCRWLTVRERETAAALAENREAVASQHAQLEALSAERDHLLALVDEIFTSRTWRARARLARLLRRG